MQCPKCAGEATDFRTSEGVVVNFCGDCHGLWFDQGELALYCETQHDIPALETLLPQAHTTVYACPRCQDARLVELPYFTGDTLLIDWCPGCHGAWLDARELVASFTNLTNVLKYGEKGDVGAAGSSGVHGQKNAETTRISVTECHAFF